MSAANGRRLTSTHSNHNDAPNSPANWCAPDQSGRRTLQIRPNMPEVERFPSLCGGVAS